MNYPIGIYLGITFSCAGVWRNGKVDIIPNHLGERTTPSIVSFLNDKILIGNQAKSQIIRNYENTIYDVKRLIGRKYTDKTVEEDMKLWPFIIEKDENNNPQIIVNYKGEKRKYYPKEISAMLLKQLKEDAEKYLEEEIKDVVITVPAYFNNTQRYETIEAAKIAGLNVIQIINEPTAAAIAYGLEQPLQNKNKKNICVFDFGGGTFDVTILEIDQGDFNIKTSEGDSHLGGSDIDNLLVKYCINKFKEEKDIDISLNNKALRRLKIYCEELKINLSFQLESKLDIDSLAEGEDLNISINRSDLNHICESLFNKCIQTLQHTLDISGLTKKQIDEIILVGGSSRIPEIQSKIKQFFVDEKIIIKKINTDEVVANGAAIMAAKNKNQLNNLSIMFKNLMIHDINPHSLGIANGNKMFFMIKKNEKIPIQNKKRIRTTHDNQPSFKISIYEGEDNLIKNNRKLGCCLLDNLRIANKGEVYATILFNLDSQYLLTIILEEEGKKNIKVLEIDRKNKDENYSNEGKIEGVE